MDNKRRMLNTTLPDNIVWEILSRLPTIAVLKCRLTCKRWLDFLSTQVFLDMHKKNAGRSNAVILVEKNKNIKLLEVDATAAETPRIRRIGRICETQTHVGYETLVSSCDGLLLFKEQNTDNVSQFLLFNPMIIPMKEVEIVAPRDYRVCGMFLHPIVKEYCILWRSFNFNERKEVLGEPFKMLTLGSQPSWTELPLPEYVSRCTYPLSSTSNSISVIAYDVLYWSVNSSPTARIIIAFDIKTETFSLVPYPNLRFINTKLLKMKDDLSVVECSPTMMSSFTINIWILKDYVNKVWKKIHIIKSEIPKNVEYLQSHALVDEEILVFYGWFELDAKGLYACNLKTGKLSTLTDPVVSQAWAYLPSLVSLMNYESFIVMPGTSIPTIFPAASSR